MLLWERERLEGIIEIVLEEEGVETESVRTGCVKAESVKRESPSYQNGRNLFEIMKQGAEGLLGAERISYFLGYLQGVEARTKDEKCLALAGISLRELEQKAGKILAERRKKEEKWRRREMIDSNDNHSCDFCNEKVNPENCYFSPEWGTYCDRRCFALYTED